ncbi:MAG: hypothetical protein ABL984_08260, partial [Pyrinomonadaceae bacterium]
VDDWVGGRLDVGERQAFEFMLARSPALREKVEVSRLLANAAPSAVVVERLAEPSGFAGLFRGWPRLAFGLAGLAVLIGILGTVFLIRRENAPEMSKADPPGVGSPTVAAAAEPSPIAEPPSNAADDPPSNNGNIIRTKPSPEPTRRSVPAFAAIVLAPPTRGTSDIRSVKLETGVEYLHLSLQTEARSSGRFRVEVGDPSGTSDWRSGAIRGHSEKGRTVVSVRVPASGLKRGLLGVRLLDADAGSEVIDEHVIRIDR